MGREFETEKWLQQSWGRDERGAGGGGKQACVSQTSIRVFVLTQPPGVFSGTVEGWEGGLGVGQRLTSLSSSGQ